MLDNELIEQFGALPVIPSMTGGDAVFTAAEKSLINEIHQLLFGKPVKTCSCNHRFSDAAIEINTVLKVKFRNMENNIKSKKYMLKAGIIIWLESDAYNRHTITDAVAEKYLKLHPDAKEREFDVVPEDKPKDDAPKAKRGKKADTPKDDAPKAKRGKKADTPKDDAPKTDNAEGENGEGSAEGDSASGENKDGEGEADGKASDGDSAVRVDTDPEDE